MNRGLSRSTRWELIFHYAIPLSFFFFCFFFFDFNGDILMKCQCATGFIIIIIIAWCFSSAPLRVFSHSLLILLWLLSRDISSTALLRRGHEERRKRSSMVPSWWTHTHRWFDTLRPNSLSDWERGNRLLSDFSRAESIRSRMTNVNQRESNMCLSIVERIIYILNNNFSFSSIFSEAQFFRYHLRFIEGFNNVQIILRRKEKREKKKKEKKEKEKRELIESCIKRDFQSFLIWLSQKISVEFESFLFRRSRSVFSSLKTIWKFRCLGQRFASELLFFSTTPTRNEKLGRNGRK